MSSNGTVTADKTADKTVINEVRSNDLSTDGVQETGPSADTPILNLRRTLFGYVKTKQFWLVLFFGYVNPDTNE